MSPTQAISPAVMDTVLAHLLPHFLTTTGGDRPAALHAAKDMIASYQAETEAELHLAAGIVSFGFHALDALGQAANPGLPLNKILRLRGSAVSLSRESHKARRKLDQLQRIRQTRPLPAQPPAVSQPSDNPEATEASSRAAQAHPAPRSDGKPGLQPWQVVAQHRRNAKCISESLNGNQTEQAGRAAAIATAAEAAAVNRQVAG